MVERRDISLTYSIEQLKRQYDFWKSNDKNENEKYEKRISALEENKQDLLKSGQNIKTINNESILGSGDIAIKNKTGILLYEGSCKAGSTLTIISGYSLRDFKFLLASNLQEDYMFNLIYLGSNGKWSGGSSYAAIGVTSGGYTTAFGGTYTDTALTLKHAWYLKHNSSGNHNALTVANNAINTLWGVF